MPTNADPSKTETDDEAELSPSMVKALNAAVTSQVKRALKDVLTKSDIETLTASIKDGVIGAMQQQPEKGGKSKGEEASPELKKLQDQIAQLAAANKASEEARTSAERGRLIDKAQADLHRMLFVEGVGDKKLKAKSDYAEVLTDVFGRRLKVTDDGKVVMTIRRAPVKGMPEEDADVSIGEGLESWIKSDAARAYLPAPSPGGRKADTRTQSARSTGQRPAAAQTAGDDNLDTMLDRAAEQLEARGLNVNDL